MDALDAQRELLRVPPGAGRAEIVAAYRRRVKELHPDRHPHASFGDRREREQETAALNAAYAALLAGGAAAREVPVDEPVEVPVDATLGPPSMDDSPALVRSRCRRSLAVIALVVTLVAVAGVAVVFDARATSTPGLAVGRCVVWSGGYTVVDCAERHDGRVSTIVARARDCPSGGFTRAQGKVFCLDVRS